MGDSSCLTSIEDFGVENDSGISAEVSLGSGVREVLPRSDGLTLVTGGSGKCVGGAGKDPREAIEFTEWLLSLFSSGSECIVASPGRVRSVGRSLEA